MPQYFIGGNSVSLGSELGSGGAGIVYAGMGKYSDSAIKIWKPFSNQADKDLTIKKVKFSMTLKLDLKLEEKIYRPLDLVTSDKDGKDPIGLRMKLYPSGYLPIDILADTGEWETYSLNQQKVGVILLNLYDIHIGLHNLNICVADGNPLNFYFHPLTLDVIAGDVDAYQFGEDLPSTAGHVEYLAPSRYATLPADVQPQQKDLMVKQDDKYLPEHDWWTFMMNAIRSLMRVHPYREGNTGIANPVERVLRDLNIFNNPAPVRTTFPLKSLPDKFLSFSLGVLNAKRAVKPERSLFEMLADPSTWHICDKHDPPVTYWIGRDECPHCAKDKALPAITAAQLGAVIEYILKQIYSPTEPRRVVFTQSVEMQNGQEVEHVLVFLSRDKQANLILTIRGAKGVKVEITLPEKFQPNQQYAVNSEYILVTTDKNLNIYSHEGKLLGKSATEIFAKHAIAALTSFEPVWLIGSVLTIGKNFMGNILPQSPFHLSHGNTWFTAGQYSDLVIGFTHWLEGYEWFATSAKSFGRKKLPIDFEPGEALNDWQVIFARDCFAVIRKSQSSHAPEQILFTVIAKDMSLLFKGVMPQETKIQHVALKNDGTLIVPTENGLTTFNSSGSQVMLGTENVPQTVRLVVINEQLVVVDNQSNVYVIRKSNQ